jgi:hypothetical protein
MYCTLEMRCRPGTIQLYIVCIHVRAWTYPMRPGTARSCATAVALHGSGTAGYGQGLFYCGPIRPGSVRRRSGTAGYGQGLFYCGPVRPGSVRHRSGTVGYGQGRFDFGSVRPGTVRHRSGTAGHSDWYPAGCGHQTFRKIGRLRLRL